METLAFAQSAGRCGGRTGFGRPNGFCLSVFFFLFFFLGGGYYIYVQETTL